MSRKFEELRTINNYIEPGSADTLPFFLSAGRDRRFRNLLLTSAIIHVVLLVVLLRLDWLAFRRIHPTTGSTSQLVKITELAAPPERFALRTRPEPLERVDVSRLNFDPNDPDDQRLLSRSPRPSRQRGDAGKGAVLNQVEKHAARGGDATSLPEANAQQPRSSAQPPVTAQIVPPGKSSPPQSAPISDPPAREGPSAPPAPSSAGTEHAREATPGTRRGTGSDAAALGMTSAQGQYIAYVRAKIIRINEENMPRKWIEDVLHDKVAAVFALSVNRDGHVGSLHLVRSCGYSLLDSRAREAILLAGPFEGYPQTAGESLQFTVTVYYTPYR